MGSGFHFAVLFDQNSLFIDEEGGAFDAHVFLAVHALFFQYVIQMDHRFIGVGQKGEVQFVFIPEVAVLANGIAADAKDDVAQFLEVRQMVAEGFGFQGTAGSIVFGVEIEDHLLAQVIREGNILAVISR